MVTKRTLIFAGLTVATLIVLSGCVGGTDSKSYKDCGTEKTCVEEAIYNNCEPATADLSDKVVTVRGEKAYGSATGGGTAKLCEVNFKYPNKEKTCAFLVYDKKTIEWYEWADEYCQAGSTPPSKFG